MPSHKLYGVIRLPEPCGLKEANVAVQMIDASIMDIAAPVLAETRFKFGGRGKIEIPFALEEPPLQNLRGRDVRIVAEVLASPGGTVAEGDYLTFESVRFDPNPISQDVMEVPVGKVTSRHRTWYEE